MFAGNTVLEDHEVKSGCRPETARAGLKLACLQDLNMFDSTPLSSNILFSEQAENLLIGV